MKGLVFTYALTYGGALISLFNPFVGLLIYVCFAIVRPESLWHWSVPAGNYSRVVAIGLLIGWAINGFGNWKMGKARPVVLAALAYGFWACLSALSCRDPNWGWTWIEGQAKILLPFFVGVTLITKVTQLKQLAWVIVLSHGYLAYDLNESYYAGFNRIQEVGFSGMDNNTLSIAFCTAAGVAFFLGLNASRWWQKLLAFASAALMVHVVFFAFSRGGMVGLIITALMTFVLIPKRPSYYLIFAAAIVLALRLAGPEVVDRFVTVFVSEKARDESAQSRIELWKICIDQMAAHPLLGLGPDHFPIHAHEFGLDRGKHAHSLWLQIGAELGIPGLIFLALFYFICACRLWPYARGRRPVSDPWFADTARMVIASLTGFVVSAQFVSVPGIESPYYVVLLGAGALKLLSDTTAVPQVQGHFAPDWLTAWSQGRRNQHKVVR
jgi:probable O-glycosylation ligase (exosortase A-associated)